MANLGTRFQEPTFSIPDALGRAQAHWNAGQADQAEMLCQRVLALWPGQADALHLLGLMAHAYGNLDLAIAHLRQACQAPRAPAVYYSNLAEMCRQRGWLAEGEAQARQAARLDPTLAGAWNNLGIILQEAGQFAESRTCLEQALALAPGNPEAHNNLGNTLKHLRLPAQAAAQWRRALALNPDYAEPHSNLAHLLASQEDYEAAVAHARRAIELKPQMADAYINLAGAELARQRYGEALRWLDALLSFAPRHAVALASKAIALRQMDRLEEALAAAAAAVEAAPLNAEAHLAHGQALQAIGEAEAALAAFARAADLPGVAAEQGLTGQALLLMEQGDTERAEAAFAQAIARFPLAPSVWFNYADFHRFAPGDPAIAAMAGLLAAPERAEAEKTMLHFALAKAHLDLDEPEAAFAHLHEGNRRKRATLRYDPDEAAASLAGAAISAAALARGAGAGAASARPVFIIGMPRAGTTLLEQILASHPAIHGAGELPHIAALAGPAEGLAAWADNVAPDALRGLGERYLAAIERPAGGRAHVIDKMPGNFIYAGFIRLILPGAKLIHVRRDPVDTCLSCYSKLFTAPQNFAYDLAELGRFHRDYQRLMAHWRAVLPATHFIELDYEALVADLEGQTRRLLAFLGLGWDEACLTFYRTRRAVKTASVNQVRQPVYAHAVGRWRRHAAALGPLLAALGVAAP
jgi:tetratricopeptide (TPR) repeat protein